MLISPHRILERLIKKTERLQVIGHDAAGEYEAADGEYLIKIRDALKPVRGMWTAYLRVRGIPERTAYQRIQASEGRYVRSKPATVAPLLPSQPNYTPAPTAWRPPSFTPSPSYDAEPTEYAASAVGGQSEQRRKLG